MTAGKLGNVTRPTRRTPTRPAKRSQGGRGRGKKPSSPRTSSTEPSPSIRPLLWAAGTSALVGLVLLVLVAAPELQAKHQLLAMAASFAPYGWLAWCASVLLALIGARGRTRLVLAPLALGLVWHTGILVPYLPAPDPAEATGSGDPSLTVLTLNLHWGEADLSAVATTIEREDPDAVVLVEVTRSNLAVFERPRWKALLPYRVGTAGDDYNPDAVDADPPGTMILSPYPVTELARADTTFSNFAVRLDLPERPVTVIAAHPANPSHGLSTWLDDARALEQLALDHASGSLVVAGDLNATAEHLTLRELRAKAGLTDAGAGTGWHPTFPADAWYPPLIEIDHVLFSQDFRAVCYQTLRVADTDHLGLLVELERR